jgi:CHAD domain-containing protein
MTRGGALASTGPHAGPFLVGKLRLLDTRLAEVAPRALAGRDENAVHDLRVALRRARVVLELGRGVLGKFHADEVRRALRDLQRATGDLRDEEVLLELLEPLASAAAAPDVEAWIESRRRREKRLRSALRRMLRAGELDRGRRLLAALLAFRIRPTQDRRLSKVARRAVEDALEDVERRRGTPTDDAEGLHRLRIAYKRLRYTVETFVDALPADFAALAHAAARFQGRLGDLHDVDVALACVAGARALSEDARNHLQVALQKKRAERVAAYERELGAAAIAPEPAQAVGGAALRKISTR